MFKLSNPNYCATVVKLQNIHPLSGCDNVVGTTILGNSVIVGKESLVGDIGLYFPPEVKLSHEFLSHNNLYRKSEWGNINPDAKGYFEEHGRVRAVKFRGNASSGFFIPLTSLNYLGDLPSPPVGTEFNEINGHEICRKYIPKQNPGRLYSAPKARGRAEDRIAAGQFNYHIDTGKLDRNIHKLQPTDIISITEKWHGTSAIFAHVLTNRPLKWYERALASLGVRIERTEYAHVWASRRVIKGVGGQPREGVVHYYKSDIWGTVSEEVKDLIPNGYTLYGEIVGWTPDGAPIQAGYHYSCPTSTHKFVVYRITFTSVDGKVFDLSWPQIKEFCSRHGLETVRELFYGRATDFYLFDTVFATEPEMCETHLEEWREGFLESLKRKYVNDSMCPFNNLEVPTEGVVLRIERSTEFEAYKKKATRFLEWETKQLDAGVVDTETLEAENV